MTEGVESDQLLAHLLAIKGGGVGWDRQMGVQSVTELCHVGSRPPWKGGVYTVRAAGSDYRLRPRLGRGLLSLSHVKPGKWTEPTERVRRLVREFSICLPSGIYSHDAQL